jgi:ElaB/YqjD/DUF883 family membrane-anchored ribosome-binding protein
MANPPSKESKTANFSSEPEEAMGAATGGAAGSKDLEAEIAQLREDLAKLSSQISATGSHSLDAARTAAQEGVLMLRSKGEEALEAARTNAKVLEDQVVASVQEKPITALAVAAAFGYLFAVLNRR